MAIITLLLGPLAGCTAPASGAVTIPPLDSGFVATYEVEGKTWRIVKDPSRPAPFRLHEAGDLVLLERETSVEGSYDDKWFEVKRGNVTRTINACITIYAEFGCSRKYVEVEWLDGGLPWFFGASVLTGRSLSPGSSLDMGLGQGAMKVGLRLEIEAGSTRDSVLVEARANRTVNVRDAFLSLEGNLVFQASTPVPVAGKIFWTAPNTDSGVLRTQEAAFALQKYEPIRASPTAVEQAEPPHAFPLAAPFTGFYPPGFDFRLPSYNVSPQYLAERAKASAAYADLASKPDFSIVRVGIRAQREMSLGPSDFASKRDVTARVLAEGASGDQGRAVEVDWTTTLVGNQSLNNSTNIVREEAFRPPALPVALRGAGFVSYEVVWRYASDRSGVPYQMYFGRDELGTYSYSFHSVASKAEQEERTVGGQAESWSTILAINPATGTYSFLRTSARALPCFEPGVALVAEPACRPYAANP